MGGYSLSTVYDSATTIYANSFIAYIKVTVPSPGVLADVFWTGIFHILRRNCLLKQIIEGKIKGQIEVTRRRGRRRKKLLDDLKDRTGCCQLKEEVLDRTMWRNCIGRGFGPVV